MVGSVAVILLVTNSFFSNSADGFGYGGHSSGYEGGEGSGTACIVKVGPPASWAFSSKLCCFKSFAFYEGIVLCVPLLQVWERRGPLWWPRSQGWIWWVSKILKGGYNLDMVSAQNISSKYGERTIFPCRKKHCVFCLYRSGYHSHRENKTFLKTEAHRKSRD